MVNKMSAIISNVAAAFLASGFSNAGMPFEIASTPVMAVQPLAKARRRSIGGHGKDASGLPNASQVAPSDQPDASHGQCDTIAIQRRCGRDYRGDSRRDADGDGKHIIDQKRCCRDE